MKKARAKSPKRPASRLRLTVELLTPADHDMYEKLKILAALEHVNVKDIIIEALNRMIAERLPAALRAALNT